MATSGLTKAKSDTSAYPYLGTGLRDVKYDRVESHGSVTTGGNIATNSTIEQTVNNYNYSNGLSGRPKSLNNRFYSEKHLNRFIRREADLQAIESALERATDEANAPSCFAIWGMAGIGKTWLAYEYLERVSGDFCSIMLKASTELTLGISLNAALKRMGCPEAGKLPLEEAVELLQDQLGEKCGEESTCKGWVIVLDDVRDDTEWHAMHLINTPARDSVDGRVLITTRSRAIAKELEQRLFRSADVQRCYELELPRPEWAIKMFKSLYNKQLKTGDDELIAGLVKAVGSLPLAVEIAAMRASERARSLQSVFEERHDAHNWETNLSTYDDHDHFKKAPILKNAFDFLLDLSARYGQGDEVAMMGDLSFLDPTKISIRLLEHPPIDTRAFTLKLAVNFIRKVLPHGGTTVQHTLDRLERLSLVIQRSNEEEGQQASIWIEIHSLVHTISRHDLHKGGISDRHIEGAVGRLNEAYKSLSPGKEHSNQNQNNLHQIDEILQHITAILDNMETLNPPNDRLQQHKLRLLDFRDDIVESLLDAGRYADASDVAEETLVRRLGFQHRNHADVWRCQSLCIKTFRCGGDYKKAESWAYAALKSAREIYKPKMFSWSGSRDEILLECMENYALVLQCQGAYKEALTEILLVVKDREARDRNHILTMQSWENISVLYRCLGDYENAKRYGELALDGKKALLEHDDMEILSCQNCYGLTLQKLGIYDEAEKSIVRVLGKRKTHLGDRHVATLESMACYASVLRDQGKYNYAEKQAVDAWSGRVSVLGREHPATMSCQCLLAQIYLCQGRYDEIESKTHLSELWAMQKEILGESHPDTLATRSTLAAMHYELKNLNEADLACVEVRLAREGDSSFGTEHPESLEIACLWARVISLRGSAESAEDKLRKVYCAQERILGKHHPSSLATINALAVEQFKLGRYNDAAETLGSSNALAWEQFGLGSYENAVDAAINAWTLQVSYKHPVVLASQHYYAVLLRYQGLYQEAEGLSKNVWKIRRKELGDYHPDTLSSQESYALALHYMGHHEDSQRHLQNVLERRQFTYGAMHIDTLRCLDLYSLLLFNLRKDASGFTRYLLREREDLPEDHPDKLLTYYNFVTILCNERMYRRAERISLDVLAKRTGKLGRSHPDTLSSIHQVGWIYLHEHKLQDAEEKFWEALQLRKAKLGIGHRDTLSSLLYYCLTYAKRCNTTRYREVLNIQLGVKSTSHSRPSMIRSKSILDIARDPWIVRQQVRNLFADALRGFEQRCREEVTLFSDDYSKVALAKSYLQQGNGDKAEMELEGLPPYPQVRTILGLALLQQSKVEEAVSFMASGSERVEKGGKMSSVDTGCDFTSRVLKRMDEEFRTRYAGVRLKKREKLATC